MASQAVTAIGCWTIDITAIIVITAENGRVRGNERVYLYYSMKGNLMYTISSEKIGYNTLCDLP